MSYKLYYVTGKCFCLILTLSIIEQKCNIMSQLVQILISNEHQISPTEQKNNNHKKNKNTKTKQNQQTVKKDQTL